MSWNEGIRTRLRLLFARGAAESRMDAEIRFHIEMETDRLVREEGLTPAEARRRALVAFGGVERTKEELRAGRGLAWLSGLRLDLKLGVRMLRKYPVLTLASVVSLTVAVALASSWFEFTTDMARPRLPLPEADRIVHLRNQDLATAVPEPRSLHDFETWRDEVESLEDLSAASQLEYNVTTEDGRFATVKGARVTPSMFRLTRVPPLLGRSLTDADLDPGAGLVVVIGHSVWQRLFDGDRSAIGQTVRLGSEHAAVVGVMPPDYGFPLNHELWTPLRESALSHERREGPALMMFGRLARDATLADARSELAVIGQRAAAQHPATHEHLRPEIRRFGAGNDMAPVAVLLNLPFLLFLFVVSANVATLLFARTAAREREIAMRSALGASPRRIFLQLVAESLVLTSLAAALGLAVASWGLRRGMDLFWEVQQMRPPFWWDSGLSATTVLYVGALAVLGAVIIGGIPALRSTRRQLLPRLTQPGAGGSGMRFGAVATGVIVVQVAICVAFIPVAITKGQALLPERQDTGFPAEAYLSGRLTREPHAPGGPTLFDEVQRRLAAEPGVVAATRASTLPGFNHPIESIQVGGDSGRIVMARQVAVDPDFFDIMGARIVSGRRFTEGDVGAATGIAIADRTWARHVFGGQSPIGQHIRYPRRPGEEGSRWYEIVGVVAGMDRIVGPGGNVVVFHPLRPAEHASVQVYLRTVDLPATLVPQVHTVVASVDPGIAMADLAPLDDTWRPVQRSDAFFAAALAVTALIILLFALMGVYALTSFTVAQRAREIAIRTALGANPRRVITAIFSRALVQVGLGILAGAGLVSLTVARDPDELGLVGGVAAAVLAVGLLASVVPAARALRIQPIEALRVD